MPQIDSNQNLGPLRFSFADTLIGHSNTGVLPALLIKNLKQHYAKNAITSYVQEIKLSLAALVNKIHVHTVRIQNSSDSIKKPLEEGITKIKSKLFQATAIYRLYVGKIGKKH